MTVLAGFIVMLGCASIAVEISSYIAYCRERDRRLEEQVATMINAIMEGMKAGSAGQALDEFKQILTRQ